MSIISIPPLISELPISIQILDYDGNKVTFNRIYTAQRTLFLNFVGALPQSGDIIQRRDSPSLRFLADHFSVDYYQSNQEITNLFLAFVPDEVGVEGKIQRVSRIMQAPHMLKLTTRWENRSSGLSAEVLDELRETPPIRRPGLSSSDTVSSLR